MDLEPLYEKSSGLAVGILKGMVAMGVNTIGSFHLVKEGENTILRLQIPGRPLAILTPVYWPEIQPGDAVLILTNVPTEILIALLPEADRCLLELARIKETILGL